MAMRKKGSTKTKLAKVNPKNMWKCKKCKESATTETSQGAIQDSPLCPKCKENMVLVGLCGTD